MKDQDAKPAKKRSRRKAASAPPSKPDGKLQPWQMAAGALLIIALFAWLLWPAPEGKTEERMVDGVSINRPAANAKVRPVLWDKPSLILPEAAHEVEHYDPTLSDDGLTLIFVRGRARPSEGADLYIARRKSISDPWGEPVPLDGLNTTNDEISPELSRDGLWLFFSSDRPDGEGGRGQGNGWVSHTDKMGQGV